MNDMMETLEYGKKEILRISESGNEEEKQMVYLAAKILQKIERNEDAIFLVTGERGKGKSTFSIWLAMIIQALPYFKGYENFQKFNFGRDNIIYEYDAENQRKLTSVENQIFVCDEIIDIGFSADAISRATKRFSKIFSKTRKLNNVYLLCIPFFMRSTSFFREIAHYWVHVMKKTNNKNREDCYAEAYLFKKKDGPAISDPWFLETLPKKIPRNYSELCYQFQRYKCFVTSLQYRPLPLDLEKDYEAKSKENLAKQEIEEEKKKSTKMPVLEAIKILGDAIREQDSNE